MPNREEVSVGDGTNTYDLSTLTTHEDGSEYQIRIEGTPGSAVSVNSVELLGTVTITESGVITTASATPYGTETASATESPTLTATGSPYSTDTAIVTADITDITSTGSPYVAEGAVATESPQITAFTTVQSIAETTKVSDAAILTASASPYGSDFASATETDIFTQAMAETTTIYISPIPRMGLDVTGSTAEIHHGTEDWDS